MSVFCWHTFNNIFGQRQCIYKEVHLAFRKQNGKLNGKSKTKLEKKL